MTIAPLLSMLRRVALALPVAALLTFSGSRPASAAGIADLFAGACVNQGCTQFMSAQGAPVTVQYFLPKANCPSPAVILLHGIDGGSRYQEDYEQIGKGLAAKGYAAFMVYYFEGAPGAIRPNPDVPALPDPSAFFPWVGTVKQAVSYVQSFPGVDPARIGILGLSLGGFVGSSAAANDPRIRSAVILSGGMPDAWLNKTTWMPRTLIIHGDRDRDVPVTEAYKMHDRFARRGIWHDLQILPCEGHLPYQQYKETVADKVLSFFDQTL